MCNKRTEICGWTDNFFTLLLVLHWQGVHIKRILYFNDISSVTCRLNVSIENIIVITVHIIINIAFSTMSFTNK